MTTEVILLHCAPLRIIIYCRYPNFSFNNLKEEKKSENNDSGFAIKRRRQVRFSTTRVRVFHLLRSERNDHGARCDDLFSVTISRRRRRRWRRQRSQHPAHIGVHRMSDVQLTMRYCNQPAPRPPGYAKGACVRGVSIALISGRSPNTRGFIWCRAIRGWWPRWLRVGTRIERSRTAPTAWSGGWRRQRRQTDPAVSRYKNGRFNTRYYGTNAFVVAPEFRFSMN